MKIYFEKTTMNTKESTHQMKKLALVGAVLTILTLNSCGPDTYYLPGPAGAPGLPGANGSDGQGCEVTTVAPGPGAPNGGSLISCANSCALVLNGTDGMNAPIIPGSIIYPVKFCPGVTVYPSKFVEVGFVIDNKLYAVYSANNGFLTEIPPGAYSSNAIGSSCNFTVNADLSISH